jgi:tetratricopeptide (TPR) repeat protein
VREHGGNVATVAEAVEWLDCACSGNARVFPVVDNDPASRIAQIHRLNRALLSHARFGRAVEGSLAVGAIAYDGHATSELPPRFHWFGIKATGESATDAARLATQLNRVGGNPSCEPWVASATRGIFDAALSGDADPTPGDVFGAGLGFLSDRLEDPRADMMAACRALDAALESSTLLSDGGVLGLDAPRPQARALLAAAWIQRLASTVPCVVVIDDLHNASSFLAHLVSRLQAMPARVLLVLAVPTEENIACSDRTPSGSLEATERATVHDAGGCSDIEAMVGQAAVEARTNASRVVGLLSDVEPKLETLDSDSYREALRLRVAAARVLLCLGEIGRAREFLLPIETAWMAEPIRANLDLLSHLPRAMARRSVAILANLHAVAVLQETVPHSAALAHVQMARLELLDRLNRLSGADDSKALAASALSIFQAHNDDIPQHGWTAERWMAMVEMHTGNTTAAVNSLRELHARQRAVVDHSDPSLRATTLALGRALLAAGEPCEALPFFDELVLLLPQELTNNPELLEARHWRASCWIALGGEADAAPEMGEVVRLREIELAVDDDRLLASRHLLGSALARTGQLELAIAEFDRVINERRNIDVLNAPALLDARASRASCLTLLGRTDEAVAELDEIVDAVSTLSIHGTRPILAKALTSRAVCLLGVGRWLEAIDDLDVLIDTLVSTGPSDALALLYARHQRAVCSHSLGYAHAALRDLNEIVTQTEGWPPSNPFVDAVALLREQLFAASPSS